MPTLLDQLLDAIHPHRTRAKIERRADEALISFPLDANTVQDGIRYHDLLCDFVRHLECLIGRFPMHADMPDSVAWQRAMDLSKKAYGRHGDTAAFEIAQSVSLEGGLYAVLKEMARHAAREQVEREVEGRVDAFCGSLTAAEYLAAGAEFLEKHSHLLPAEMKQGYAGRVRVNLRDALKLYHRAQDTLNRVGEALP
jgi:hypothetical protein